MKNKIQEFKNTLEVQEIKLRLSIMEEENLSEKEVFNEYFIL